MDVDPRLRGITNIFDDPLRTPEDQANFDAAMADLTRLAAKAVASVYDFTPFRVLVDVGGGNGVMTGILKPTPRSARSFRSACRSGACKVANRGQRTRRTLPSERSSEPR
jgi:hypothetical protein